jgi:hypothetical protein
MNYVKTGLLKGIRAQALIGRMSLGIEINRALFERSGFLEGISPNIIRPIQQILDNKIKELREFDKAAKSKWSKAHK